MGVKMGLQREELAPTRGSNIKCSKGFRKEDFAKAVNGLAATSTKDKASHNQTIQKSNTNLFMIEAAAIIYLLCEDDNLEISRVWVCKVIGEREQSRVVKLI